jgi:hypothetical protein
LLVLSQESNAKTCASLVLRVEREAAQWSEQSRNPTAAAHTPGSLLKGATPAAEVVRSRLKYKRPRPIDQSSSEASGRFHLHSDPHAAQLETFLSPQKEQERMQNPG